MAVIDEICTNDFTLSWTATSNETGLSYTVVLSLPSQSLTTTNTSYNFTELIPNVTYNVTVVASSNSGSGIPAVIMVTTLTVETGRPMGEIYKCYMLKCLCNVSIYTFMHRFCIIINAKQEQHMCETNQKEQYLCIYGYMQPKHLISAMD